MSIGTIQLTSVIVHLTRAVYLPDEKQHFLTCAGDVRGLLVPGTLANTKWLDRFS